METNTMETPPVDLEVIIATEAAKCDKESAQAVAELVGTLGAQFTALRELRIITVTDIGDKPGMKSAREARLKVRAMRIEVENARKELKESSLRRGQAIDKIAGIIKGALEPIEAHLLAQETFAERAEAERVARVGGERLKVLRSHQFPAPVSPSDLADMSDADFDRLVADAKSLNAAKLLKEKQDADERAEREKIAADKVRAAEQETARIKAAAAAEREEARKREEASRIEREKLEKEIAAKRAEEERARQAQVRRRQEEESARIAAEAAPDAEKIRAAAKSVRDLNLPVMSTAGGVGFAVKFEEQRERFALWMEGAAKKLTEGVAP